MPRGKWQPVAGREGFFTQETHTPGNRQLLEAMDSHLVEVGLSTEKLYPRVQRNADRLRMDKTFVRVQAPLMKAANGQIFTPFGVDWSRFGDGSAPRGRVVLWEPPCELQFMRTTWESHFVQKFYPIGLAHHAGMARFYPWWATLDDHVDRLVAPMLLNVLEYHDPGAAKLHFLADQGYEEWEWPQDSQTQQKLLIVDHALKVPHGVPQGKGARISTTFRMEALEWLTDGDKDLKQFIFNTFRSTPVLQWQSFM